MLTLIHRFAALTLICGVLTALLPEGSVKKTATMAMGLIVALCWLEASAQWFSLPEISPAPATVLTDRQADALGGEGAGNHGQEGT